MNFLTKKLILSSITVLNRQFTQWVEDEYNHKKHSVLGMKPIDRYALDRSRIRYLPNINANDELFYAEETRSVINTNTFSFRGKSYEAPAMLAGKKIQIRFDRKKDYSPVIVYFKGDRIGEAKLLDYVANGLLRNKKIQGGLL